MVQTGPPAQGLEESTVLGANAGDQGTAALGGPYQLLVKATQDKGCLERPGEWPCGLRHSSGCKWTLGRTLTTLEKALPPDGHVVGDTSHCAVESEENVPFRGPLACGGTGSRVARVSPWHRAWEVAASVLRKSNVPQMWRMMKTHMSQGQVWSAWGCGSEEFLGFLFL